MAIDRGPWNALVDDDGTNLVGSIWNKAAINTVLLNPIDALVGPWVLIPHNAAHYGASSGTWTVSAANQITWQYAVVGKTLLMILMVNATSTSATPARLRLTFPASVPIPTVQAEVAAVYAVGSTGGTGQTEITAGSGTVSFLRDILGTPWPVSAGNLYLRAQFFYQF